MAKSTTQGKLGKEEFVKTAILRLRRGQSKGIHTVYSKFNDCFRTYFEGDDPVKAVTALVKQGKFEGHMTRGGYMLYLKGEMPKGNSSSPDNILGTLNTILAK